MDPGTDNPARLSFSSSTRGGDAVVTLAGELNIACVPAVREQLFGLMQPGVGRLIIDMSQVTDCDASGLAVLVGSGRRAELLGGALRLAAPAPEVARVLHATGLCHRLDVFATIEAALIAPPRPGSGPYLDRRQYRRVVRPDFRRSQAHEGLIESVCAGHGPAGLP